MEQGKEIEQTIQLQLAMNPRNAAAEGRREPAMHSKQAGTGSSRRTWGGRQLRALLGAAHALGIEFPALQVGVHHKLHLITRLQDVLPSHLRYNRDTEIQQQR
jgi:hypothetical protein